MSTTREITDRIEAVYTDDDLTREEKIAKIAALYGITDPISAPELFARIRGFDVPPVAAHLP